MIQRHVDLKDSIEKFNISAKKNPRHHGVIQKIYSTPHLICLMIRYPGITRFLYFGRGGGHEGIWEGKSAPPPFMRIRDRFLEYCRAHLSSSAIGTLFLDKHDRIVGFSYARGPLVNYFLLFYKGRKLYFSNYFHDDEMQTRLFLSWKNLKDDLLSLSELPENDIIKTLLSQFDEIGRETAFREKAMPRPADDPGDFISRYLLTKHDAHKKNVGSRDKRFHQRKAEKIMADLRKVQVWKTLAEAIEDIKNG